MIKKAPKKNKNKFSFFFIIYLTFSLSSHGKKKKPDTFSALFVTGNTKTARENVPLKMFLFFFFLLFCILPLCVIEKIATYLFFSKFRLKVPKTAAKRAQVSFFTNYLFSALIPRTHTPSQTHSVFPNHNAEKTRLTSFSKNYFFLLSTPSPYPRNTS